LSAVRPGGYHRSSARTSPRFRKLAKKTGLAWKPCVPRCCCRCPRACGGTSRSGARRVRSPALRVP